MFEALPLPVTVSGGRGEAFEPSIADLERVLAELEGELAVQLMGADAHDAGAAETAEAGHCVDEELGDVAALALEAATCPPGPRLASLLAWLRDRPLDEPARVDFLVGVERLERWAASLRMPVLRQHLGERVLPVRGPDDTAGFEQRGRVAEVAVALECSESAVQRQWGQAREVAGPRPALGDALTCLASGELSSAHLAVLVEETVELSDDDAREVARRVVGKAAGRSPARFRQICRRAVAAVDEEAAARRQRGAAKERSVRWWPERDGMARLEVYAPAPDVLAINDALDRLAGPREADDPRSLAARRVDALVALCLGIPPARGAGAPCAPVGSLASDDEGAGRTSGDAEAAPQAGAGDAAARRGCPPYVPTVPVQAQIVIDLATLLGLADHPAELRGYGAIPAGTAREWLTEASTWRRLVVDPVDGHLLDYGPSVRLAPGRLRAFVAARDQVCTFPGCGRRAESRGVEVDHHPPWRADGTGGRTSAEQTAVLCAHHHHVRTHGGWQLLRREAGDASWRSPSGRDVECPRPAALPPV